MTRLRGMVLIALALATGLAACGSDEGGRGSSSAAGTGASAGTAASASSVASTATTAAASSVAPTATTAAASSVAPTATAAAASSVAPTGSAAAPDRADNGDLTWGDGDYGVVLAHGAAFDAASWQDQATAIAGQGATVVAVQDISAESIATAVKELHAGGIDKVALVGGSAGADAILRLVSEQPDLADQLVLLSPNTVVEGLGSAPKLFIASRDEPGSGIPQKLVDANPDGSEVLLVPGSAHAQNVFDTDQGDAVLDAMLQRLSSGKT